LYVKWLEKKLIPNLPAHAVIVLDNTSYHNDQIDRPPTMKSRKDIMEWLDYCGICYAEDVMKIELYEIIKLKKPTRKTFTVNSVLAQHGHFALRLPPCHPQLNSIEQIWGYCGSKECDVQGKGHEKLAEDKFSLITTQEWASVCKHVKEAEKKYIKTECVMENIIENFVINLGSSDSDLDTNWDDEDKNGMAGLLPLSSDSE
jgi:hypothetical protein